VLHYPRHSRIDARSPLDLRMQALQRRRVHAQSLTAQSAARLAKNAARQLKAFPIAGTISQHVAGQGDKPIT
jgi:hypothetical protein